MSLTDDQAPSPSHSPSGGTPPAERAQAAMATARQEAQEVAHQASESASAIAAKARDEVKTRSDEQAHRAAEAVRGFSHDLRRMADAGEEEDATPVRDVVRTAAEKLERFSDQLDARGFSGLVDDVADFGRRNPGIFLLAAAAAGAATARLFRTADTTALKDATRADAPSEPSEVRGGSPQALASSTPPEAAGEHEPAIDLTEPRWSDR